MLAASPRSYVDVVMAARLRSLPVVREALLLVAGSVLIAAAAQVVVPFFPVPATLQTFAVLLLGATFGARRAALAALLYLGEGAAGLPVFAAGGFGVARLLGPTAGYLWAFPLAAWVAGVLVERGWDRRFGTALLALLIGDVLILAAGSAWLAAGIGAEAAWRAGVAPFVPFDALKIVLAAGLMPAGRRWLDRRVFADAGASGRPQ